MSTIPQKVKDRHGWLVADVELHEKNWRLACARLAELEACIAAYAAESPNAEAVGGEMAPGLVTGAPDPENALAGEFGGLRARDGMPGVLYRNAMDQQAGLPAEQMAKIVNSNPSNETTKRPRAPRLNIRGMVLNEFLMWPDLGKTVERLAEVLHLPRAVVEKAVAYWQAKGRLTLDGGVVRLVTEPVADAPPDEITTEQIAALNRIVPDAEFADYKPVEPQQSGAA